MTRANTDMSLNKRAIREATKEISRDISESIFYNLFHAKHLPEIKAIERGKLKTKSIEKIKSEIKKNISK